MKVMGFSAKLLEIFLGEAASCTVNVIGTRWEVVVFLSLGDLVNWPSDDTHFTHLQQASELWVHKRKCEPGVLSRGVSVHLHVIKSLPVTAGTIKITDRTQQDGAVLPPTHSHLTQLLGRQTVLWSADSHTRTHTLYSRCPTWLICKAGNCSCGDCSAHTHVCMWISACSVAGKVAGYSALFLSSMCQCFDFPIGSMKGCGTTLKGQFTQKSKTYFTSYLWCYLTSFFWCELQSVGDISHRDVCLLLNIMELDGTPLLVLKMPKNTFEKLSSNVSLQKSWPKLHPPTIWPCGGKLITNGDEIAAKVF